MKGFNFIVLNDDTSQMVLPKRIDNPLTTPLPFSKKQKPEHPVLAQSIAAAVVTATDFLLFFYS